MYTSWLAMLIISLCTSQNTNPIEFNCSLLILDNISIEVVASLASVVVTSMTPSTLYQSYRFLLYVRERNDNSVTDWTTGYVYH
jgi:hypothetical protein